MNVISSYKTQLNKASKRLVNNEKKKLKLQQEMALLQEQMDCCDKNIAEDKRNKVLKGMQYFSKTKREELLNEAEELSCSRETIARLRSYDDNWNEDCIDCNIISDFMALEKTVNDNKPDWEKSFFTKLGKAINQNE